jgi:endonuclease/exonuclease/phosphatase family metal-dependent hydrolase
MLRMRRLSVVVSVVAGMLAGAGAAAAKVPNDAPATFGVMTRNVYLGADLTAGVHATDVQGLVNAAGGILNQVDENKFQVRAKGLAAEILGKQPALVGLQEVADWRTEPCTQNPLPPKATQVRYDYLKLLLAQLNKGKRRYKAVIAEPEFDFEVWANTDGNDATGGVGCPFGSEIDARLTMRDVILARVGAVTTSHAKSGHYKTLLQEKPAGVALNVTRGWVRVDAKLPTGFRFRFVDTHLESFDSSTTNATNTGKDVSNGQIRKAQAKELFAKGGPATGKLPVVLVGDLNSDKKTSVKPGDGLADEALLKAGFAERSTTTPLGCCLNASILTTKGGGKRSDFDHKVDHIMTNRPKKLTLLNSSVTGLKPVNGFWDSDHAGLFSTLQVN